MGKPRFGRDHGQGSGASSFGPQLSLDTMWKQMEFHDDHAGHDLMYGTLFFCGEGVLAVLDASFSNLPELDLFFGSGSGAFRNDAPGRSGLVWPWVPNDLPGSRLLGISKVWRLEKTAIILMRTLKQTISQKIRAPKTWQRNLSKSELVDFQVPAISCQAIWRFRHPECRFIMFHPCKKKVRNLVGNF